MTKTNPFFKTRTDFSRRPKVSAHERDRFIGVAEMAALMNLSRPAANERVLAGDYKTNADGLVYRADFFAKHPSLAEGEMRKAITAFAAVTPDMATAAKVIIAATQENLIKSDADKAKLQTILADILYMTPRTGEKPKAKTGPIKE